MGIQICYEQKMNHFTFSKYANFGDDKNKLLRRLADVTNYVVFFPNVSV